MTRRGATTAARKRGQAVLHRAPAPIRILFLGEGIPAPALLAGLGRHGCTAAGVIATDGGDGIPREIPRHDAIVIVAAGAGRAGLGILRAIRERDGAVPVVLVTGGGAARLRILGLDLGADACLAGPVHAGELAAQLRAVLRRAGHGRGAPIRHGGLALDPITREACGGGEPVGLTAREFSLLSLLLESPGTAFGRDDIARRAWGRRQEGPHNLVDVVVSRIRRKLGACAGRPVIETVHGIGYRVPGQARPA